MTLDDPASVAAAHADPAALRRSYVSGVLDEATLAPTWLDQLQGWYDEAAADERIGEANAMQLATADVAGRPDVRTVLARGFDPAGIVFYTNYDSAKGRQLAANPVAAGVFSWLPIERQVRFRGPVVRVSRAETEAYFAGRPRGAQLGAWASPQSTVIPDRAELAELLAAVEARFGGEAGGGDVPPPPDWGGFRLTVHEMEFWQGREFRLHDRLRYRRDGADWTIERLAP